MAVGRSFLKGLGLNEEQINAIIDAHTETIDGLKAQITEANNKRDAAVEELNAAKNAGWEQKYNDLNSEFENFKTEQTKRAAKDAKAKAYTELLKEAGVSEKRINSILRVTDIDAIELDDKGNVKDSKTLTDSIKKDWADFITVRETHGADVQNPPKNDSGSATVTADDFKKMSYRQRLELYQTEPDTYKELTKG